VAADGLTVTAAVVADGLTVTAAVVVVGGSTAEAMAAAVHGSIGGERLYVENQVFRRILPGSR
jgi:hypothetical protein